MTDAIDPRFPIGPFQRPAGPLDSASRRTLIDEIERMPAIFRGIVSTLDETQLDTPYRPGGWTVRQVVHHVPDSHMNAYIRFKLALTEDNPTIKPYNETAWAEVADTARTPVDTSLRMIDALHERWVILLESMEGSDFTRPLQHPERGPMTLDMMLQLYSWHGRHHVAHITGLREREGWG
jgi:uncharacterized damage-inducible protein DinB